MDVWMDVRIEKCITDTCNAYYLTQVGRKCTFNLILHKQTPEWPDMLDL